MQGEAARRARVAGERLKMARALYEKGLQEAVAVYPAGILPDIFCSRRTLDLLVYSWIYLNSESALSYRPLGDLG